jgi:hypothetical protein
VSAPVLLNFEFAVAHTAAQLMRTFPGIVTKAAVGLLALFPMDKRLRLVRRSFCYSPRGLTSAIQCDQGIEKLDASFQIPRPPVDPFAGLFDDEADDDPFAGLLDEKGESGPARKRSRVAPRHSPSPPVPSLPSGTPVPSKTALGKVRVPFHCNFFN